MSEEHPSHKQCAQNDLQHVQQAPHRYPQVSVITRAPPSQPSLFGQEQLWNDHHEQELERLENLHRATTFNTQAARDITSQHLRSSE